MKQNTNEQGTTNEYEKKREMEYDEERIIRMVEISKVE